MGDLKDGKKREEPTAFLAEGLPIQAWRERSEPAAVTFRCQAFAKRCRKVVAHIFETPRGAVVVFYQNRPNMPVTFEGAPGRDRVDGPGELIHHDGDTGRALMRGRDDDRGVVVSLESDDHWADIVRPSCPTHTATFYLPRTMLLDALRRRRTGHGAKDVMLGQDQLWP